MHHAALFDPSVSPSKDPVPAVKHLSAKRTKARLKVDTISKVTSDLNTQGLHDLELNLQPEIMVTFTGKPIP